MKGTTEVEAGVCGFHTTACATSEDSQHVTFRVHSDCDKIGRLGAALAEKDGIDAYQEISAGEQGVVMQTVHATLTGCCAGCAVPVGLFKAMQVAAGLALARDIHIKLTSERTI
jgi:hypothetical protein